MPRVELFQPASQTQQGQFKSSNIQPTNASTEVDLGREYSTITIGVRSGANDMHVSFNRETVTTSMGMIPNGTSLTYTGVPIRYFTILSTGAASNRVDIFAN